MKEKSDLVLGWLKKAASDLVAMRASAQAGALDAACFHAQQAAEKYLKAYLAESELEILHTHNLYKLVTLCAETDSSFRELIDAAEMLTPFAVVARYDTEFWPASGTVEQAERSAKHVADFVSARVRWIAWKAARDQFNWKVDLRKFQDSAKYPGFFDRVIEPHQIVEFEDAFRAAMVPKGRIERAMEVVFWKNYGNFKARNRITRDLMDWVDRPESWTQFVDSIKELALAATWKAFQRLLDSSGQKYGFATPLTFLSFYDPQRYPMVDKRIGAWWARQFQSGPQFIWDGEQTRIVPGQKSWEAYLAWTEFCRQLAADLSRTSGVKWRARDVEMAVWTDVDAKLQLTSSIQPH